MPCRMRIPYCADLGSKFDGPTLSTIGYSKRFADVVENTLQRRALSNNRHSYVRHLIRKTCPDAKSNFDFVQDDLQRLVKGDEAPGLPGRNMLRFGDAPPNSLHAISARQNVRSLAN